MRSERAAEYCTYFDRLKTARQASHDADWQVITDYIKPQVHTYFSTKKVGTIDRQHIYDSAPERASEDLASALLSMMISPGRKYINFEATGIPANQIGYAEKEALQRCEEAVLDNLASSESNFLSAATNVFQQLVDFGQSYVVMKEDVDDLLVKYCAISNQEVYVQRDEYGVVTSYFRLMNLTARQIEVQFANAVGSEADSQYWNDNKIKQRSHPDEMFEILHFIVPAGDSFSELPKIKKFASVTVDYAKKVILKVDGFDVFPVIGPSWERLTGQDYGRGPAHRALGDVISLHKMNKDNLAASGLMIQPSILMPWGIMVDEDFDMSQAAINYIQYNASAMATGLMKPEPFHVIQSLPVALDVENQRRNAIREAFYGDLLLEFKNAEMSATETSRREEARIRKLTGPMLRIEQEFLAPICNFTLKSLVKMGVIELPDSLKKTKIKPRFTTALYDALKMFRLTQLERGLQSYANIKGLPVQALEAIKQGGLATEIFDLAGASLSLVEDPEVIKQKEQARMQNEAMMQQAQALSAGATATKNISDAFVNTRQL